MKAKGRTLNVTKNRQNQPRFQVVVLYSTTSLIQIIAKYLKMLCHEDIDILGRFKYLF